MTLFFSLVTLIAIAALGFWVSQKRVMRAAGNDSRNMHSLPGFYGWNAAFSVFVPATAFMLFGLLIQRFAENPESALIAPDFIGYGMLIIGVIGGLWAVSKAQPDVRARNLTERWVMVLLIAAASIAILTTVGIVMSMLLETLNFFDQYALKDFFFNIVWSPDFRGGSDLGILPLLWGTLYISFVALVVAVPIGLFAAIYMSEYAGPKTRSIAKPLIEILAGIPTIVYGLFALVTVGPLLRDWIAQPSGLGDSGSSVMTAGLVMGIMLIPFVSSLSDDIINAVPQAMRDGSYGLGATKSETIRQVVVPAALPGIVGAILLAASRAIGETMIVVLGAGASAAQLGSGVGEVINPFEAMTTVTVKIVSQLTGDTDFSAPETLVAFALGLTLFVFTLGLNVLALYVVRKYREQYE
ncbi:phosphate ABC transporter permease subunit PstC [Cochlodiniinecator piscidefendens]|uniref:phosphate ABC transporter permease subunit PstC n=1 Tax=Cochlodiniinecator piscidefendens TaxID=2715756 RepID=UPI00140900DE|nr:phosphate ABC transporter permease subunit PstC [Cochlodiniinecator piscidefendens]